MSGASKKLMGTTAAGGEALAIEDVFGTYVEASGAGTTTVDQGIDLAGEGGMWWGKIRNLGGDPDGRHEIHDTERGAGNYLRSDTTAAQSSPSFNFLSSFTSTGYTGWSGVNGYNVVSWTFRKAPRFFDVVTYTGTGANQTIAHNLGTTVGTIITKRVDASSVWGVYHRSLGATQKITLNETTAAETFATYWNNTEPTDTEFTVGTNASVNTSGGTYIAYLFAHDPLGPSGDGSDGLIACGSYTGNDGTQDIDLGFEPQWILVKSSSNVRDWKIIDNMRGFAAAPNNKWLTPNSSNAEENINASASTIEPTATGFRLTTGDAETNASGWSYIYIAIRRGPMRAPTSGTEVFAVDTYASSAANAADVRYYSGFPVDFTLFHSTTGGSHQARSRLTGGNFMNTDSTAAETSNSTAWYASNVGVDPNTVDDTNIPTALRHMFRRAPGFFDVVAYTGVSGADTVSHNLGVVPEMIWVKSRTEAVSIPARGNWVVYHKDVSSGYLNLHNTAALQTADAVSKFGNGSTLVPPTDTNFTVADDYDVGRSANNYIAYLFATLPGVSKVGSYTGNGTSQTINCGFTSGARFVLIKCTTTNDSWFVFDTARGIVSGNDPYLNLDNTDPEGTSQDFVDPDPSGFSVVGDNVGINRSGDTYIFYAIA